MNTEKAKTSEVVAGRFKNTSLRGKRLFSAFSARRSGTAGLVIVAMVVLLLGAFLYNAQHAPKCNADILAKARRGLHPQLTEELPPVAKRVLAIKDYQKDANCDYIVTAYYIQIGDAKNAQISMDSLKKAYSKKSVSKNLGPYVLSLDGLGKQVDFLVQLDKEFKPETAGYPQVTSSNRAGQ